MLYLATNCIAVLPYNLKEMVSHMKQKVAVVHQVISYSTIFRNLSILEKKERCTTTHPLLSKSSFLYIIQK